MNHDSYDIDNILINDCSFCIWLLLWMHWNAQWWRWKLLVLELVKGQRLKSFRLWLQGLKMLLVKPIPTCCYLTACFISCSFVAVINVFVFVWSMLWRLYHSNIGEFICNKCKYHDICINLINNNKFWIYIIG